MISSYFLTCIFIFLAEGSWGAHKEGTGTFAFQGCSLLESSDNQNCSSVLLAPWQTL